MSMPFGICCDRPWYIPNDLYHPDGDVGIIPTRWNVVETLEKRLKNVYAPFWCVLTYKSKKQRFFISLADPQIIVDTNIFPQSRNSPQR